MPDVEPDDFGPAMSACLSKERAFIVALLEGKSGADAARAAGWGNEDGTSSAETYARVAHRALTRARVNDALVEHSRKTIRSLAPSAIQAVREIIGAPGHKDRAKVALNMIERVDPTVTRIEGHITHTVDHEGEALKQLRSLRALGVARDKLVEVFGEFGLQRFEKKLAALEAPKQAPIDVEYEEIITAEDL